jgi:glycosyltransferase involved in cell wall biosynthesis
MSFEEKESSMETRLRPTVSVITICLNPGAKLLGTLQSVLEQTGVRVESVVIDGGSTDPDTLRILSEIGPRLGYLQSRQDAGISDALNQGLRHCSGDWIVPLNAGDRFLSSDSLARFFPEPGGWEHLPIRAAFARFGIRLIPGYPVSDSTLLRRRALISHQATLVHRRVYESAGHYDLRFRLRMDYDFWLRALSRFPLRFIPEVLVDYETGGISGQNPRLFLAEELLAQRLRLANPFPANAVSCAKYIVRSLRSGLGRLRNADGQAPTGNFPGA